MKVCPGITLFQVMAPVRARAFLGLGDVSGSRGIWEKVGLGLSGLVVKSGCSQNFPWGRAVFGCISSYG